LFSCGQLVLVDGTFDV